MADQDFDFEALKALKINQYKKEHLKPAIFKKSKGAIIFVDYKMAGKKTPCVIVPFKKGPIAAKTFKTVKKNKEHILKKTAFAALDFSATDEGKTLVTITLKKGGLSADMLTAKAAKLFGEIKMDYKVVGMPEDGETSSDDTSAADTDPAEVRKQAAKLAAVFKAFVATEWAAVKENSKSAKVILAADSKGRAIATKMANWLTANADNPDAALESTAISTYQDKLNGLLDQIKGKVEKISKAKEGTAVDFDSLSGDISASINSLLEAYGEEISQFEGLKDALDGLK